MAHDIIYRKLRTQLLNDSSRSINKMKPVTGVKLGFWSSSNSPCISTIDMEDTLFNKITHYHYHTLQSYLPDRPAIDYNGRERHHNKTNS